MNSFPKISRMGKRSILLQFEPEINAEVLKKVLSAQKLLQDRLLKAGVEVTSAYNSLLVTYHNAIEDPYSAVLELKEEIAAANIHFNLKSQLFEIPVCYDDKFGLDLQEISETKDLSKQEIIRFHSEAEYLVYFTGFLPGFLYLGGLPEKLHFPRRKNPRQEVQKGAVGIGEKQTGIYPQKSPGGWNIIGNSPVPLFDPFADPPCEIKAGDRIKFYPVSLEEYQQISAQVEDGNYVFKKEAHGG